MRGWVAFAVLCGAVCLGQTPKGFPQPRIPADNPRSAEKAELGRYLFYDKRLSVNGKMACATCHRQELAFTDGRAVAVGTTGETHSRGSMSLVNVAYSAVLSWSESSAKTLERQALIPLFRDHPVEMGAQAESLVAMLRSDVRYTAMFERAFPESARRFTVENAAAALACFERTIVSARSPYDRYHYGGDDGAVTEAAKRGETLFFSQPLSCFRCHGGFNFTGGELHNTGIGEGSFKAPTLRNIAVTGPYMHDGSIATLEAVVDRYAGGARGKVGVDPLIGGFVLRGTDRADLLAFLRSLTDEAVLRDARFADPW